MLARFEQQQLPCVEVVKVNVVNLCWRLWLAAVDPNMSVTEAFRVADDVLRSGVRGISDIITVRSREGVAW